MFSCWLTFHCELRPSDILHVLIWPSEQFELETLVVKHKKSASFPMKKRSFPMRKKMPRSKDHSQNDRWLAYNLKDTPLVMQTKFPQTVMVFGCPRVV